MRGRTRTVHYCSCGRPLEGNRAWRHHRRVNPTHRQVPYDEYLAIRTSLLRSAE